MTPALEIYFGLGQLPDESGTPVNFWRTEIEPWRNLVKGECHSNWDEQTQRACP